MIDAAGRPEIAPQTCTVAATHHWLVRRRGGEKVFEALLEILPPRTPIYTLVYDPAGYDDDAALSGHSIHTSWLQRIPGARRHYPKLLPLMPAAARALRLPNVDLVVCSDAAIAKAMTPHPRSRVVCYCHSPMRYVWDLAEVYGRTLPIFLRPLWPAVCARQRAADAAAADRVDIFVANSNHVADRIRRAYGRESTVVYPPVEIPEAPPPASAKRERFFLCVGHHVAYKRLDLAVEATRMIDRELIVIGEGPGVEALRRGPPPHVRLLGWQPDEVVRDHYRRAAALLFPGEEDFGIVPVEAMAHGCPVIAFGVGGAAETVIHARTGVLFRAQVPDQVVEAIRTAERISFDEMELYERARQFSHPRFLAAMRAVCSAALDSECRSV
ncbi:MAG: glycosyltransferase [Phycisphaerales bacterium]|nr:glycosyltransferase [Phycisphaerales bacterium]